MRFHEFSERKTLPDRTLEIVVSAPEVVAVPKSYRTVSDTDELLLHIPIEPPEKASKRRMAFLLALLAARELEKEPTDQEWEVCRRAYALLKEIASKDYQLAQLKKKQSAKTSFAEIEL